VVDLIFRFLIGGLVVSAFAILGDLLEPKSFAGLFGAAPSIALATLGLTIHREGAAYAAAECRSMLAGAVALGIYAYVVCRLLIRRRIAPLPAALSSLAVWFAVSVGSWLVFLR
jgi:hypothetical protein